MNAQRRASAAAEMDAAAAPGCHLEASRMPGHWLLARMGEARRRVRAMRGIFRQYAAHMRGAAIVARKPMEESP